MTNAPEATPDRRESPPAHPHATGAAVATRFGRAGNQGDTLFARRRRESWKVEHAQGLAWADLYLPLPVRGTDFVALSRSARALPGTCTERQIATENSGGCRSQHKRPDHPQAPDECRLQPGTGFLAIRGGARPAWPDRDEISCLSGQSHRAQSSANVRQKRGFDDAPGFTALRVAVASR